jgi:hypothetical protein
MEILSRVHATNLVCWTNDKPEVLVLSADLTSSTEIDLIKDDHGLTNQPFCPFAAAARRPLGTRTVRPAGVASICRM